MIRIPVDMVMDSKYSDIDILVWTCVQIIACGPNKETELVDIPCIMYHVYNEKSRNSYRRANMIQSLCEMVNNGVIIAERYDDHRFIVHNSTFDIKDDVSCIEVEPIEFRKVMQTLYSNDREWRRFLMILVMIDPKLKYGSNSLRSLEKIMGDDIKAISNSIKRFEESNLLYVNRGVKRPSYYGRARDKNAVDGAVRKLDNANYLSGRSKHFRQLTMQYREVAKGNPEYVGDPVLMGELRDQCESVNAALGFNKYDLSVF